MSSRPTLLRSTAWIGLLAMAVWFLLPVSLASALTSASYEGTSIRGTMRSISLPAPGGTNVNTFTGNLFLQRPVLPALPGRGVPLEAMLTYNSSRHSEANHAFGVGWYLNYQMSVRRYSAGKIVVTWGDGRNDRFVPVAGGYEASNPGVFASLDQPDATTLRATTPRGIQFLFPLPAVDKLTFLKAIKDPNGNELSLSYADFGRPLQISDASGRNLTFAYAKGRVSRVTDSSTAPPRSVEFTYDAAGNQASTTDPLGRTTHYAYDATNRLSEITDPTGVTRISYNGGYAATEVERTEPGGALVNRRSFEYDTAIQTTRVTDFVDSTTTATTTFDYGTPNRLVVTDPLGHQTRLDHDPEGNVSSRTDPNGHAQSYSYDTRGNLLTATDALGKTTTYTYGATFAEVTSATDPLGNKTLYSYDARGNLTEIKDARGFKTRFTYDAVGQMVKRLNARNHSTAYEYDASGNITRITDALGRETTVAYDGAGRPVTRTSPRGQTVSFQHDAVNQLTQVDYPGGDQGSFTYDPAGNLATAVDPDTDLVLDWDAAGLLSSIDDQLLGKAITYSYDGRGLPVEKSSPDIGSRAYDYDLAGRPMTLTQDGDVFKFSHDNGNRLVRAELPNGVKTDYTYDAADRLTRVLNRKANAQTLSSEQYHYDADDRLVRKATGAGITTKYTYNTLDALGSERRNGAGGYAHTFTYDGVGNRKTLNADGAVTNYTYGPTDQLMKEQSPTDTVDYLYDESGNVTDRTDGAGASTYAYDAVERLTAATTPAASATYAYDALDRRTSKTVNGGTVKTLYDGIDPLAEYSSGALSAERVFGPGVMGLDRQLAQTAGGATSYLLKDRLDSTTALVDPAGALTDTYEYDAWGLLTAQTGSTSNDDTFTGRMLDRETSLYYNRARQYDPTVGRFTQTDPLADPTRETARGLRNAIPHPLGLDPEASEVSSTSSISSPTLTSRASPSATAVATSPYGYVENGPTNRVDPTGEFWWWLLLPLVPFGLWEIYEWFYPPAPAVTGSNNGGQGGLNGRFA